MCFHSAFWRVGFGETDQNSGYQLNSFWPNHEVSVSLGSWFPFNCSVYVISVCWTVYDWLALRLIYKVAVVIFDYTNNEITKGWVNRGKMFKCQAQYKKSNPSSLIRLYVIIYFPARPFKFNKDICNWRICTTYTAFLLYASYWGKSFKISDYSSIN